MKGAKIFWYYNPAPDARADDKNQLARLFLEKATRRKLLPKGALQLLDTLSRYVDAEDLLLAPLRAHLRDSEGPPPSTLVELIRRHAHLAPPELAQLVKGEEADLSRYTPEYRKALKKEAEAWRRFLAGKNDRPPGFFALNLPEETLADWLDLAFGDEEVDHALQRVREVLARTLEDERKQARIERLRQEHHVEIVWSPVQKFRFDDGHNPKATASGKAGGKSFTVTFESVFDFGLVIRTSAGSVYRRPEKGWLRAEDGRPLDDPSLEAFLEVATATSPPALRGIRM
ncbi:hypothetical protein [Oceanithermus sp.]|uniref:hypothetical protein n=1 Tax=Oceanithermus sp. TaxID=2268145 RepID=UPI00257CE787|nr:hypothetical protein [Oceanithermus sp.]